MKIRNPVMNSSVSQEFAVFCSHTKQLKRILAETQSCFRGINNAANVNGNQLNAAELSELEEAELEALVKRPPGIVILGQTAQARATVVNEILGKEVLPTCTDLKHNVPASLEEEKRLRSQHKWRTVRLKYGRRQRVAFCLTNSFELLGEIDCTEKTWTTVPLEILVADRSVPPLKGIREQAQIDGQGDMDSSANSDGSSDASHEEVHTDTEQLPLDENQGQYADKYKMSDSHLDSIHQELSQKGLDQHNPATDYNDPGVNRLRPQHEYIQNNKSASKDTESQNNVILSEEQHYQASSSNTERHNVIVEVTLNHPIFSDGAQIIVEDDDDDEMTLDMWVDAFISELVPIFVYALSDDVFMKQEIIRLKKLHELLPGIAIFFVKVPEIPCDRMKPSASLKSIRSKLDQYSNTVYSHQCPPTECTSVARHKAAIITAQSSLKLFQQLLEVGYLNILPGAPPTDQQSRLASDTDSADYYAVESELAENFDNFTTNFIEFVHKVLHCHLVKVIGLLNLVHTRCLQTFILSAFDMARDMLITPKRITFAKEKENELYSSLMTMALQKQDEIRKLIAETVKGKKDELIEKAANYEFIGVEILPTGEVSSSSDLKKCTCQIQDLVLGDLNSAVADKLLGSVDILKDSYTGVLTRCLESLEQSDVENKETLRTSMALKEILTSAYQVEITVRAGASIVKVLLEKMKQLIHSMPWHQAPRIDREWKKQVATNMLNSLSEARLAKSVCRQIKERLKHSHETFSAALKQLEARHSGRLERTEEQRLRVRKVHAPRVARLALESTSFKDLLVFGMPKQGKEIGRGQYGVVHACDAWGGFSPCAIKSVVPPDDRHWNDLAMEFFYTKNVPEHDRVVTLRGSVIDYSYSGGNPAVLLIMDRLVQDLYNAIKNGLSWPNRLQVAIDVVEGIRYLHSQGLVHRDIKLKNVLLDKHNRGKLTDLGFCKPEAMMSGSIVGTPMHMAPELFSGHYDNSVDTYAFGILFWYVCAGHVHLPYNFEQCTNKEMLWTSVRRGVRPERLPQFDSECWELMQSCWHADPSRRPLLGFVEPKLRSILKKIHKNKSSMKSRKKTTVQQREVSLQGDLS